MEHRYFIVREYTSGIPVVLGVLKLPESVIPGPMLTKRLSLIFEGITEPEYRVYVSQKILEELPHDFISLYSKRMLAHETKVLKNT